MYELYLAAGEYVHLKKENFFQPFASGLSTNTSSEFNINSIKSISRVS